MPSRRRGRAIDWLFEWGERLRATVDHLGVSMYASSMMKAIQILMDGRMLAAIDREAKRRRSDRSKLIRVAVARLLAEEHRRALEEEDRAGFERVPQARAEWEPWQEVQAWAED